MADRNEIIDIRSDATGINLLELTRTSLKPTENKPPTFPELLLWDAEGLKGFEAITYLDTYYLTNCEIGLLQQHGDAIAQTIQPHSILIELGSG